MSYTFGAFQNYVFESLERDPRWLSSLDEACNSAIDETLAESNYGNLEYDTLSVNGQEIYNLPPDTLYVNFVTYDNVPLDRMTFDEYLQRKALINQGIILYKKPVGFLIKDNRDLALSPTPPDNGLTITIYCTVKTPDMAGLTSDPTGGVDFATNMPFGRVYANAAKHYARFYLLQLDGQDDRATSEYKLFEHEMGKTTRRLIGSVKTKVKRML